MRLLSYENGTRTYVEKVGDKWNWKIEHDDVDVHTEFSRSLQNDPDHWKDGMKKDMVHYCHIPPSILMKWHFDGVNINNARELINMVNRPEWRYLKCVDKVIRAKE